MTDSPRASFHGFEQIPLREYTQRAYLDYSMYVVLDRPLPFLGDGLKPVPRRFIFALSDLGLSPASMPLKAALTVGVVILGRLSPADPVLALPGEERDPAVLAAMREDFGLNQPVPVQYVAWITHLAQGDLGRSFQTKERVLEAIVQRLPATAELGLAAILISVTIALAVGILSAIKRNSFVDIAASMVTVAGISFPSFFLGIGLVLFFE